MYPTCTGTHSAPCFFLLCRLLCLLASLLAATCSCLCRCCIYSHMCALHCCLAHRERPALLHAGPVVEDQLVAVNGAVHFRAAGETVTSVDSVGHVWRGVVCRGLAGVGVALLVAIKGSAFNPPHQHMQATTHHNVDSRAAQKPFFLKNLLF